MTKTARAALGRRGALLLPLGAGGCSLFDNCSARTRSRSRASANPSWPTRRGMQADEDTGRKVVLPPAVRNAAWPQAGGNPAHVMGHLGAGEALREAWRASIGEGGGYRREDPGPARGRRRHGVRHGFRRRGLGLQRGRRQPALAHSTHDRGRRQHQCRRRHGASRAARSTRSTASAELVALDAGRGHAALAQLSRRARALRARRSPRAGCS